MDLKTQVNFKDGQSFSAGDAPGTQGRGPEQGKELRCADMALLKDSVKQTDLGGGE